MRPFPWKCGTCGKRAVNARSVEYVAVREHDGRAYSLKIPNLDIYECDECHARTLPDASFEKVTDALRAEAGLLTPTEIRENRKRLGLNQEQLANSLRVAKETVSRWETGGQIQQRAMDLLLRVFFGVPQVRYWLDHGGALISNKAI
jgi:putative zinc finger/helix-turn-helix YgiT family protein